MISRLNLPVSIVICYGKKLYPAALIGSLLVVCVGCTFMFIQARSALILFAAVPTDVHIVMCLHIP